MTIIKSGIIGHSHKKHTLVRMTHTLVRLSRVLVIRDHRLLMRGGKPIIIRNELYNIKIQYLLIKSLRCLFEYHKCSTKEQRVAVETTPLFVREETNL